MATEIMAGSGLDWILINMEHAPNGLESVLSQLYAMSAYRATPVVRLPSADPVVIKQVLDVGAQNLLIPMISTSVEAAAVAAAAQHPPIGRRGVGSALARSARWNRVDEYLRDSAQHVSVFVQIESSTGVDNARAIAETPGIDGVFVGPSDLAASMGLLGQQSHPEVVAAVEHTFAAVRGAGKPLGVNASVAQQAERYIQSGATFLLVCADAALLARASESSTRPFHSSSGGAEQASY